MPIALADLLDERRLVLHLHARTMKDAMRELCDVLAASGAISDASALVEQVCKREEAATTLVEHGVAFPHARTDLVSDIVLAIGRSRAGIPWNAGGESAHLVFLIAVPQKLATDYLMLVGKLARITNDPTTRDALVAAATPMDFAETLRAAPSI